MIPEQPLEASGNAARRASATRPPAGSRFRCHAAIVSLASRRRPCGALRRSLGAEQRGATSRASERSAANGFAEGLYRLESRRAIEERAEHSQVEIREQAAAVRRLVESLPQDVDLDARGLPEPHLAHSETPVDSTRQGASIPARAGATGARRQAKAAPSSGPPFCDSSSSRQPSSSRCSTLWARGSPSPGSPGVNLKLPFVQARKA